MTRPPEDSHAGAVGAMTDAPDTALPSPRRPTVQDPHNRSAVGVTGASGDSKSRALAGILGRTGSKRRADAAISTGGRRPTSRSRAPKGAGPFLVVAAANTIWAAIGAYLPVLLIFLAVTMVGTPAVTMGSAARYAAATWVLAHGVPLSIGGYPLGLVPLAVTILAAWRVGAAGRRVARASRVSALAVITTIAIAYALVGMVAAAAATGGALHVPVVRAGLTCAAFGFVCAAVGTSAGRRQIRHKIKHVPKPIRDGVRGGLVATALVIAAGAMAAGVAIAVSGATAAQILHNYRTGVTGEAGIVLVCLAYAPNVAVWAAAYLAGPGFTLAGVPAQLPVFAGLPEHPVTGAAQALLLVPVVAGFASGILALRRRATGGRPGTGLVADRSGAAGAPGLAAMIAGPVAGVVSMAVLLLVGRAASGPLGSQLLAHTGEVGWQFPLLAGAGIAVGTLLGVAAYSVLTRR